MLHGLLDLLGARAVREAFSRWAGAIDRLADATGKAADQAEQRFAGDVPPLPNGEPAKIGRTKRS